MSNIIKIVAVLRAKAGHEATVKQALLACVEGSRKEEGCTFYDLHIDRTDPQRFLFIEGWKDLAAINTTASTSFRPPRRAGSSWQKSRAPVNAYSGPGSCEPGTSAVFGLARTSAFFGNVARMPAALACANTCSTCR